MNFIMVSHQFLRDSFRSSKIRFERYFYLKWRCLFLSGCSLIAAFLKTADTCYGFSISVKDIGSHSVQIWCKVAKRVVVLLIFLPSVYPHFYLWIKLLVSALLALLGLIFNSIDVLPHVWLDLQMFEGSIKSLSSRI